MTTPLEDSENTAALKRALFALKDMRAKLDAFERAKTEPIAIIGIGCRFPGGANDPETYWKILNEGIDVITEVPANRWDIEKFYDPDPNAPGKMYVRKSGFIDNVDKFEAQFFGISPREVASMDPQQRILLEVAWEALEHAGIVPATLAGSQTGVFVGMSTNDYTGLQVKHGDINNFDAYIGTGTSFSVAAGRISYVLGLHGPTLTLDTACSSSLVAIHLACQSLRSGQSNMALAGGVSLILAPEGTVSMSKSHALAPDGYSKTFDAAADGYARGEGCGVIVLKRLSDAIAAGDNIVALIKGSAINHDGRSSGLTVPNGMAQQAVIRAALEDAGGVDPHHVHFVETHGTGTQLGDPIEVRALAAALGKDRAKENPLVLGSVKANVGHLEAAAGMAGIVKVVLAFQHDRIPKQVHFQDPNPKIEWDSLPVKVADENEVWLQTDRPRIAGVNSFGFSGTNAHIVLEEAPPSPADKLDVERPQHLLTLSANHETSLAELATRYIRYFETHTDLSLEELTYTANSRRTAFTQRLALIGNSKEQILEKLKSYASAQSGPGMVKGQVQSSTEPKIAFLFTGQGSQYIEMGLQLYETEPVFRSALERCDELLRPYREKSILTVIFPKSGEESPINETAYTQLALFAIEYALAELWRSWGIAPAAVMGHSVGEYVAACVAGLFSLEDGLKLIAERGRLMQSLPPDGAMAAIFADKDRVAKAIAPYVKDLSIAALNGPENIVISGRDSAVQAVLDQFAQEGIKASRLSVSHAFHSPLMDSILDSFERAAGSVTFTKPKISLISNVTGGLISLEEISRPSYWRTHIRQPVQFQKAMETLRDRGCTVFVEIGPQPTLLSMGQRCISGEKNIWVPSLRQRKDDWSQMLESLGTLFVNGIEPDWEGFYHGRSHKPIPLPTYPFQGDRYWFKVADKSSRPERQMLHPLLGHRVRSPKLSGAIFETELSVDHPSFLNDHRIYETTVFPATGFMEMALAAAQHAFGEQRYALNNVLIREALILPDENEKTVQVTLSAMEAGKASFEIFSLDAAIQDASADSWKQHATGTIEPEPAIGQAGQVDLEILKLACPNPVEIAPLFQRLFETGIQYGPAFQGLAQIWQGENQALGEIILPPDESTKAAKYQIHPALLDTCFRLLGVVTAAAVSEDHDKAFVPVAIQKLVVFQTGQSKIWAHVAFSSALTNDDGSLKQSLLADLKLFGSDGSLVAAMDGLQIMQISRASLLPRQQRNVDDWFYEVNWQVSPITRSTNGINRWLIFADEHGVGDRLAEQLTAGGSRVTVVKAGDEYRQVDGNNWQLSPSRSEDFRQFLSDVKTSLHDAQPGVIHLWSLNDPFDGVSQKTETLLRQAQELTCGSILHLVQELASASISPAGLWLVTQNAQRIKPEEAVHGISQASVWGMARTIAMEYPNWKCACVDISENTASTLLDSILAQDDENQIALRGEERFVARLDHLQKQGGDLTVPSDEPFELVIASPGVLDQLNIQPTRRRAPEAGEVEIRVRASGLNFRDVLNALGMYPGPKIPLGSECAGVVVAVGSGVTEFKVGDEVLGLTTPAFRSFATIPVERVFPKPADISLAQAAAIPTVFLTAYYGLHHLAGMKTGDRVLIHAAAGGVGLAAVQLAQRAGAEIYATAGSNEKREYLRSLGVQHIFDSRHLNFAEEIMQVTNGAGVNIVLNSLADEFIPKSLSVLADGGYFLEMGKRDDWNQEKVSQLYPTLKYYRFDLGTEMVNDMAFIGKMMREILAGFESGVFRPLPVKTFGMPSVRDAFRYMAQAKQIGKVVITQDVSPSIRADGTYLITGGLGGLGLVTARWLVEQGAKHLMLMSRREPNEQVRQQLDELRANGAEIRTIQGDIARREDVERALQVIEDEMPSLRGIFHEAGVLDDGVLSQQSWSRFEHVMNPKVLGAWYLHELTQKLPLDFFVLFSSAAAVLGSAGQVNYAAANSFLNGLAHYRKSIGLPATSINWGAWSEVGMAAALESRSPHRGGVRAADSIHPMEGMQVLEKLIHQQATEVVVLPTDWKRVTGTQIQPILRQIVKVKEQPRSSVPMGQMLEQIKALPSDGQINAFHEYARQQVVNILGLSPLQSFNSDRALTDLGLDSLMAVELKNKIEGDLRMNIPVTYFLEGVTVAALSKKLHEQFSERDGGLRSSDQMVDSEKAKELLSNLDRLSEDEVDSLIGNLLASNEDS